MLPALGPPKHHQPALAEGTGCHRPSCHPPGVPCEPRPGLGLRERDTSGRGPMAAVAGQGRERRRRRGKGYLFSSMVTVHRLLLTGAHSGLLMPLCPGRMAWNVRSPILPLSLPCCSGDVTDCPARALLLLLHHPPPSPAFSLQQAASARPCPDPPPLGYPTPQHGCREGAV